VAQVARFGDQRPHQRLDQRRCRRS
jgi:hypothetical protein